MNLLRRLYNVAHLFYRNGRIEEQAKLHITPTEVEEWKMSAGDYVKTIDTDKGRTAILTCYDIEYPKFSEW